MYKLQQLSKISAGFTVNFDLWDNLSKSYERYPLLLTRLFVLEKLGILERSKLLIGEMGREVGGVTAGDGGCLLTSSPEKSNSNTSS